MDVVTCSHCNVIVLQLYGLKMLNNRTSKPLVPSQLWNILKEPNCIYSNIFFNIIVCHYFHYRPRSSYKKLLCPTIVLPDKKMFILPLRRSVRIGVLSSQEANCISDRSGSAERNRRKMRNCFIWFCFLNRYKLFQGCRYIGDFLTNALLKLI